jgi:SpoVK/Ycf46/Vps4 family AAA+-type ATPase
VNFDPAFERRIRTHVRFEMPGLEEREQIWKVQLHPLKTPLAADVNFRVLAERYEVSGGDIKNAVLKAATMAASEAGADSTKMIRQSQFERAMDEVVSAKSVMQQSLFTEGDQQTSDDRVMRAVESAELRWRQTAQVAVAMAAGAIVLALIAITITLVRAM